MEDVVNYDYGVDLNSNFNFTSDGDLRLSLYDDNISQAIANRLKTIQDSMSLFYTDYGSLFIGFLGWRRNQETLDFMKIELDTTLSKDPRINDFTTDLNYDSNGGVKINIRISNNNEVTELNYVMDSTNIEEV